MTKKNPGAPFDYIIHEAHDPDDGTAYFGPIPLDVKDPLNGPASDFWAQTGSIDIIYRSRIPEDAYVNPWSAWLDPDFDPATETDD